jgi:SAM-dependent methyltransferase
MRLGDLHRAIVLEWEDAGARESERYVSSFGLTYWEQELYPRFLRRDDRILVVGCGTGRDLVALLQRGYRAAGLDLSSGCTATARDVLAKRGLEADVFTGDIATVKLPGSFDAFVFSALTGAADGARDGRGRRPPGRGRAPASCAGPDQLARLHHRAHVVHPVEVGHVVVARNVEHDQVAPPVGRQRPHLGLQPEGVGAV